MRTKIAQSAKSVSAELFLVQMVLAVSPTNPEWCNVGFSAFAKGERHSYTGSYPKYFTRDDPKGRELSKRDRPPNYYGERFWTDSPAFLTADAAHAFRDAAIRGGWCRERETRVVKYAFAESVVEIPAQAKAKRKKAA